MVGKGKKHECGPMNSSSRTFLAFIDVSWIRYYLFVMFMLHYGNSLLSYSLRSSEVSFA